MGVTMYYVFGSDYIRQLPRDPLQAHITRNKTGLKQVQPDQYISERRDLINPRIKQAQRSNAAMARQKILYGRNRQVMTGK